LGCTPWHKGFWQKEVDWRTSCPPLVSLASNLSLFPRFGGRGNFSNEETDPSTASDFFLGGGAKREDKKKSARKAEKAAYSSLVGRKKGRLVMFREHGVT
jgi:hypothetical protein